MLVICVSAEAPAQGFVPGDVNGDGGVDLVDDVVLRRHLLGLGPGISQMCTAVCGNGVIETGEQCEPSSTATCPGLCQADCRCGLPPPGEGKIGSACASDSECLGQDGFCLHGFCTRTCGSGGTVSDCNSPLLAAAGPFGSTYGCWPLGPGFPNLCWPNGSGAGCATGADCPRAGEICHLGRCTYGSGSLVRSDMRCHRDTDCQPGEGCTPLGNLDAGANVRTDGACLWAGDPPDPRSPPGAACEQDGECASFLCRDGSCTGLCRVDADCGPGTRCQIIGFGASFPREFAVEFLGVCGVWAGSDTACGANADCAGGESCAPYLDLGSNDLAVAAASSCRARPNPLGAAIGAGCDSDSQCASGNCLANPLTGLGYCTDFCVGGDADCGGGTSCRSTLFLAGDPATSADDLRVGSCRRTDPGQVCTVIPSCKTCNTAFDCDSPTGVSQGLLCVRVSPSDPLGTCRDVLGRCADPCHGGCVVSTDCPPGATCTSVSPTDPGTYCADAVGECVRADFLPALRYEHGLCGDVEYPLGGGGPLPQNDLCYFYGRVVTGSGPEDVFACGKQCAGDPDCSPVPTLSDPLTTVCRTVYEFGASLPGPPPVVLGGAPLSPDQCAPPAAFVWTP